MNERIRGYLKLEQQFKQLDLCLTHAMSVSQTVFFSALFSILDHLDRNDTRGDLIKDLEKLESKLVHWSRSPEINNDALQNALRQTVDYICQLKALSPQYLSLKDDKLLASIRQRFAIQGGNSSFDLPQLTFWINQPETKIAQDIEYWRASIKLIEDAVQLVLQFIREKSDFTPLQAQKGFYQDSGDGIALLRVQLDSQCQYFPTISGNKYRYSIRFVEPCQETGKKFTDQCIAFELAQC
jgi:cell division protein ZapD